MTSTAINKIAFLGDYMPRKCGIATFTSDLRTAIAKEFPKIPSLVIPVNDREEGYDYPSEVRFEIQESELLSYQRAADFLNLNSVDVVCVQHEYGIYGGSAGGHLLALLRDLKMPIVTTLHTILATPDPAQHRVMKELIQLSTRLVTMTNRGETMLKEIYQAPPEKIDIIPHGIPDVPFVDPHYFKDHFGVEGKTVLLTFGLLSPNKGIEYMLNALPKIVKEFPDVVYIVLGATHPNLVRDHGESYRLGLEHLAKKNGIQKNVIFHNRFVELDELNEFIGAADVYITPYLNEAQITSGTLAYTFGAGKPIVSTPYWHAAELLAHDRGVLVPFADVDAMAQGVIDLLRDDNRRHAMRRTAYKLGRDMTWSRAAQLYLNSFERARLEARATSSRPPMMIKTLDQQPGQLPEGKIEHLTRMTDATGLFQHAVYTIPDFKHGYCTDDNARGLIFTVMREALGVDHTRIRDLGTRYAAFLNHAFNPATNRFRNFMSFERKWLEEVGSEDSHGRALWALGVCVGRSEHRSFQRLANQIFDQALAVTVDFRSPRAWAFALIGIHEYLRRFNGDRLVNQVRETLTAQLMRLYREVAGNGWWWFEDIVAYDNAKLSHALILSGRWTQQAEVLEAGLKSLRWLADVQLSEGGYFRPVGSNGFYRRGGRPAQFDQQPLEAHCMISACIEAFRTTNDAYWFDQARLAFEWFLGRNDLGQPLYEAQTGGCRDGLHLDRVNQNQGAESTLAYLLSLTELQLVQNAVTSFKQPIPA